MAPIQRDKFSHAWKHVPAKSCPLRRPPVRLTGGSKEGSETKNWDKGNHGSEVDCYCGAYRAPEEFVQSAVEAGHPVRRENRLPAELQEAIQANVESSRHDMGKCRIAILKRWARAEALSAREASVHDNLEPHLKPVLEGKRLPLWKEMLT